MNILPKKNQLLHPPSKPLDFHYVKRRELNDGCGIIWGIVLLIFPVSMLMYSLYRGGFGVSLLFLAFTIYFIYFFITEETSVTQVREKIPDDLYKNIMEEYKNKILEVNRQNELIESDFQKKYHEIIQKNINKVEDFKIQLYYKELIPISISERNFDNIKIGKYEIEFLSYLIDVFGNQIKVDISPKLPYKSYFPDFVYICNKTGLHIDIEIDEPYSMIDKIPIHFIDSSDFERNEFFLNQNWSVIRFSELQVVKQPDECINLISNYVNSIIMKQQLFEHELNQDSRWTYEQALVMANKNYRNEYLN
ncbi:MAG: hypothetical protein HUU34_21825 [Saprospiraceae bacterium]|nr:hypothetical protein [Saprospiraceae bacterium]